MDNAEFFDINADAYESNKLYPHDDIFINFIKRSDMKASLFLDVGGGSGFFAKLLKDELPFMDITIVDPSTELIAKINDPSINTKIGSLPNNIGMPDSSFDYIHIRMVIHHLVGNTIGESQLQLKESLRCIRHLLKDGGYLFLHDYYYESFISPSLARNMIFYILKLQKALKIKIPTKEFVRDLSVCFYTRVEFRSILAECGFEICEMHEEFISNNNIKFRLLLLNKFGSIAIIAKRV